MKIAYVTVSDLSKKSSWTKEQQGLCAAGYNIAKYLTEQSTYIDYLGPLTKQFAVITKTKWTIYHHLFKKDYYRWAEPLVVKNYAFQIQKKILSLSSDIVLCPENIVPIAYLECKQPIVLWTDAPLGSLINFYRHMNNLCNENIKNIHKIENEALNRCKLIIYTSEWAAQTAINIYGIAPSKIKVIPWGPNLECHRNWEDIKEIVESKKSTICKLLFIGVDWIRKGGDKALQVAKDLNNAGLQTELIVIGCKPKINDNLPNFVKVIEFIDKSKLDGLEYLNRLFAEAHFLILPTYADCTPHVFSEANSFGIPCLSTNVGGITTIIRDNLNGKTFTIEANTSDYCHYIMSLMNNYSNYKKLAFSSFLEYQTRLNWNIAVKSAKNLMKELI